MKTEYKGKQTSLSVSSMVKEGLESIGIRLTEKTGIACSLSKVVEYLLAVEAGRVSPLLSPPTTITREIPSTLNRQE